MVWKILLFLVINLFYLFLGYGYGTERMQILSACGIFGVLLVSSVLYSFYGKIQDKADDRIKDVMYQQQLEYYTRQYEDISRSQQETRKMRHELKNHYILIKALAEKGDCEGIIEVMNQVYHEADGFVRCKTGNLVVDAVMNDKISVALADEIQFDLKLNIPTKFDTSDIKLCGLLGNALDNAIEACRRLPAEERRIKVSMAVQKKNLFIEIKNPYDGTLLKDQKGHLLTRKEQAVNHGFGLSIMEELLRNNYGSMETVWDGKVFCLRMILYMVI